MLEVVERIQMLDWNLGKRRYESFVRNCSLTFAMTDPAEFIGAWAAFQGPDDFIRNLLDTVADSNVRYLLKEYERKHGVNLHFKVPHDISDS